MKEKIIGAIAGLLYRIYSMTFRYQFYPMGAHSLAAYEFTKNVKIDAQLNLLYGAWHQDELGVIGHFKNQKITIIVSESKDGIIFSTALRVLGFRIISGSSSRGGARALLSAINEAQKGYSIAVALDGPRGPRFKVKEGIIKISEKTQRPIVPMRIHPRSYYTFKKSWAQTKLPLPFSKVDIYFGEPKSYTAIELEETLLHIDKIAAQSDSRS